MAVNAAARPERSAPVLRFFDIVLIVVAAPIMLLIGVSAPGYLFTAAAWIVVRILGIGVDRYADGVDLTRSTTVRMVYMLGRLFALAIVVILVRQSDGQGAGLASLAVIVFAFTISLLLSALNRPTRSRSR